MLTSNANAMDILSRANKKTGLDVDRWIFVFMALFFLLTVFAGFIPTSIAKVAAIQAGTRPAFPAVLHIHAVLMGTWIMLLLTQTSLVATNHRALHQKLGLVSVVLVPAMVLTGFILVPTNFHIIWGLDPAQFPPEMIAARKFAISNIALAQIRIGILFPFFIGLALYYRKRDSNTHKRLMFLATVLPLPAAFDRIAWLPSTLPESPLSPDIYILLWMSPLFIYDLLRYKQVPRAYIIWIAGILPFVIAQHALWGSPWWMATVPKIMGVES